MDVLSGVLGCFTYIRHKHRSGAYQKRELLRLMASKFGTITGMTLQEVWGELSINLNMPKEVPELEKVD